MRIVDNGWRMPFFGKLEKHVGFRIRSKGPLCGKSVYQAKKFGDADPKIATSQKAHIGANCAVRNNLSRKTLRDLSKKFSPIFRCKNRGNHALNGAAKKNSPQAKRA